MIQETSKVMQQALLTSWEGWARHGMSNQQQKLMEREAMKVIDGLGSDTLATQVRTMTGEAQAVAKQNERGLLRSGIFQTVVDALWGKRAADVGPAQLKELNQQLMAVARDEAVPASVKQFRGFARGYHQEASHLELVLETALNSFAIGLDRASPAQAARIRAEIISTLENGIAGARTDGASHAAAVLEKQLERFKQMELAPGVDHLQKLYSKVVDARWGIDQRAMAFANREGLHIQFRQAKGELKATLEQDVLGASGTFTNLEPGSVTRDGYVAFTGTARPTTPPGVKAPDFHVEGEFNPVTGELRNGVFYDPKLDPTDISFT